MTRKTILTYNELILLPTFEERFNYLSLPGMIGMDTFGFDRAFNQMFYRSSEWKQIRNYVITRDNGCDLAVPGFVINDKVLIHHMNPIDIEDIKESTDFLMNPDYLITTCLATHNAIHYGRIDSTPEYILKERTPGDTKLW